MTARIMNPGPPRRAASPAPQVSALPHPAIPTVGFLFVGGAHQMLHILPVAAALARSGGSRIILFVGTADDRDRLTAAAEALGSSFEIRMLPSFAWLRPLLPRRAAPKKLQLLAARRLFRRMHLLVTAERTSTVLKRLPGVAPYMLHIPHGAGDRDRGFETRLRLFDHVIVAGRKDRDRMVEEGLVPPEGCSVSGYVKLAAVLRLRARRPPPPLFDNDRPVVLYNPHFSPGLTSWDRFGQAFAQVVRDLPDHNFILAPHVRLAQRWSRRERALLESLGVPGRVLIDLGSERSCDMSYTIAADIYVGDVSSQVYEFLHVPKPCVFLNATGNDQAGNRAFAFWRFGDVVDDPAAWARAIVEAPSQHARFAQAQRQGVADALGPNDGEAPARAAEIVGRLARRQAGLG